MFWVARNKNGSLSLFKSKEPHRGIQGLWIGKSFLAWLSGPDGDNIEGFEHVTWEGGAHEAGLIDMAQEYIISEDQANKLIDEMEDSR